MNRVSDAIKKLFPDDFDELTPVKRHWWERIHLDGLASGWKMWTLVMTVALSFLLGMYYYNRFVVLETQVLTDKSQIEAQLQRRKDLIINLTKTVIDYSEHERSMFRYMADKRASSVERIDMMVQAAREGKLEQFMEVGKGDKLEGILGDFMALAENYPELKLSSNFQKLMDALINIEDRIVERRMAYNTSCNKYGSYIRKFPQMLYAGLLQFKQYPFVEVDKDVELFNRVAY